MHERTQITRVGFLKTAGAAALTGSTLSVLSACQMNTTPSSSGGGGGGPEEKVLNLYNWSDYVAKSTIPNFEKQTGIKVTQDYYSSNEELLAKLQAGGGGSYDVIVPSDYMVTIMAKSGVIQPLDKSKIPNFKNIGKNFRGLPFDPHNKYSVPYQWGTTGILYNRKEVGKVTSWDAMWDPRFKGRIGMINDERETPGAALYKLGYSVNTTDSRKLNQAKAELMKQKPLLRGYFDSTQIRPLVQKGDLLLGHVYSGDAFLVLGSNPDLDYAIPKPAATRWTDNMAIPKGAPHPDNAHKFINYILGAKAGAALSNYTYYNTPNKAALPLIDNSLKKLPGYTLSPDVYKRLQVIEDVGKATRKYSSLFTAVKSA